MTKSEVTGIVEAKNKTGLKVGGSWFNKSQYGKFKHNWESVEVGDKISLLVAEGTNFANGLEILAGGTGIKPQGAPSQKAQSTNNGGQSNSYKEDNERRDRSIAKSVIAYSVFQSPTVAEMLKSADSTSKKLATLLGVADSVEDFLFSENKETRLSETMLKRLNFLRE